MAVPEVGEPINSREGYQGEVGVNFEVKIGRIDGVENAVTGI